MGNFKWSTYSESMDFEKFNACTDKNILSQIKENAESHTVQTIDIVSDSSKQIVETVFNDNAIVAMQNGGDIAFTGISSLFNNSTDFFYSIVGCLF